MQANPTGSLSSRSLPRTFNRYAVAFVLCAAGMQAHATYTPPPPCANPFTPRQEMTEDSKVAAQVYQQTPVLRESDPVSQYIASAGCILYNAGYDPRGLAQFFEIIQSKYGSGGAQILTDHPNPGNRTE